MYHLQNVPLPFGGSLPWCQELGTPAFAEQPVWTAGACEAPLRMGGGRPRTHPGNLGSQGGLRREIQLLSCSSSPGAGVALGARPGDPCLSSSGTSLEGAQPEGAGRRGRSAKRGGADVSLSLINSGSCAPRASRLSAAPAIRGSVNWGQGSGEAGVAPGDSAEEAEVPLGYPLGGRCYPVSRAAQKPSPPSVQPRAPSCAARVTGVGAGFQTVAPAGP